MVESLTVCPLQHSLMVYRSVTKSANRSYVQLVKQGEVRFNKHNNAGYITSTGICKNLHNHSQKSVKSEVIKENAQAKHISAQHNNENVNSLTLYGLPKMVSLPIHRVQCSAKFTLKRQGIIWFMSNQTTMFNTGSSMISTLMGMINSSIHYFNECTKYIKTVPDCDMYYKCREQSNFSFGFVPQCDQILPDENCLSDDNKYSLLQLFERVKSSGKPNFLGAKVHLRLHVDMWKQLLSEYWDKQLLQFLEFGFPVRFNMLGKLNHTRENHKSAVDYLHHVKTYLDKEIKFGAVLGPFQTEPVLNLHISPLMMRQKPNSETRRLRVDLSWPLGVSVHHSVENNVYMGSEFTNLSHNR